MWHIGKHYVTDRTRTLKKRLNDIWKQTCTVCKLQVETVHSVNCTGVKVTSNQSVVNRRLKKYLGGHSHPRPEKNWNKKKNRQGLSMLSNTSPPLVFVITWPKFTFRPSNDTWTSSIHGKALHTSHRYFQLFWLIRPCFRLKLGRVLLGCTVYKVTTSQRMKRCHLFHSYI